MSNQISHLSEIAFEELNIDQLFEVLADFEDKGQYPREERPEKDEAIDNLGRPLFTHRATKETFYKFFEDNYYDINALKDHFNFWNN